MLYFFEPQPKKEEKTVFCSFFLKRCSREG